MQQSLSLAVEPGFSSCSAAIVLSVHGKRSSENNATLFRTFPDNDGPRRLTEIFLQDFGYQAYGMLKSGLGALEPTDMSS